MSTLTHYLPATLVRRRTTQAIERHGAAFARLAPTKVALYGVALYAIVFLIAPVRVMVPLSLTPAAYLFFAYFLFCIGTLLVGPTLFRGSYGRARAVNVTTFKTRVVTLVAVLGVALRFADRFIIRGMSLADDVITRRRVLESAGSGPISILAALLYPFCYLPLFMYLLEVEKTGKKSRLKHLAVLALFFYPTLDSLALGSRSLILVNVSLFVLFLQYFGKLRLNIKIVIAALLITVLLLTLSSWIFLERLSAVGMTPAQSVYRSVYAFTVEPNSWSGDLLGSDSAFLQMVGFTYLYVSQYFVHGVLEFGYLMDHFRGPHTYGADMLGVYFKFIAAATGAQNTDDAVMAAQPRTGIFTTFFGPLYVDFGWVGIPLMLLFGVIAYRVWRRAKEGDVAIAPFAMYLTMVVFFMPVVNMIATAQGVYALTALAAFALLMKRRSRRLMSGRLPS